MRTVRTEGKLSESKKIIVLMRSVDEGFQMTVSWEECRGVRLKMLTEDLMKWHIDDE